MVIHCVYIEEVPQNVVHVLMLWYVKRSKPFSGLKGPGDGLVLLLCVQTTFRSFPDKNCGQIFSNVVFLIVTMYGYPAMMPVSQLDFMVPTDISNALWTRAESTSKYITLCLKGKLLANTSMSSEWNSKEWRLREQLPVQSNLYANFATRHSHSQEIWNDMKELILVKNHSV